MEKEINNKIDIKHLENISTIESLINVYLNKKDIKSDEINLIDIEKLFKKEFPNDYYYTVKKIKNLWKKQNQPLSKQSKNAVNEIRKYYFALSKL